MAGEAAREIVEGTRPHGTGSITQNNEFRAGKT